MPKLMPIDSMIARVGWRSGQPGHPGERWSGTGPSSLVADAAACSNGTVRSRPGDGAGDGVSSAPRGRAPSAKARIQPERILMAPLCAPTIGGRHRAVYRTLVPYLARPAPGTSRLTPEHVHGRPRGRVPS